MVRSVVEVLIIFTHPPCAGRLFWSKLHMFHALVEVKSKDQVLQATWEIHVLLGSQERQQIQQATGATRIWWIWKDVMGR